MNRIIGPWDPKGSEKDIENVQPVPTRERVCLILYHVSLIFWDPNKSNVYMIGYTYVLYMQIEDDKRPNIT